MKFFLTSLIFCFFAGTLFLRTSLFVNAQVTPKWYFGVLTGLMLVLTLIIAFLSGRIKQLHSNSLLSKVCLVITILCLVQSVYGILQYFRVLPASNGLVVTGSFDNPAGFAACLCAGFPFCFYFASQKHKWQWRISLPTVFVIIIAIVLSASRAGIVSLLVTGLFLLFYKIKIQVGRKMIFIIASVVIVLSGLYFLKKDSADGRLLIWRCSWEMIKDKPLFGYGHGGFKANYMKHQAEYFEEYPDSKYAMLADNVNRPFNEYILLLANYGIFGLILLLSLCWFLWKSFLRCRHEHIVRIAAACLLSVAAFAFFSYPSRYPFVWIMLILSISIIIYKAGYSIKIPKAVIYTVFILLIPVIIFSGFKTYQRMRIEMLWCKIANQSLAGRTDQMLPVYDRLHKSLKGNELFLYNYAAELNVVSDYNKSLQTARECEKLWADYDLQMLMADNCEKLNQYEDAEMHFKIAAAMCPVRFMPLYRLVKLYDANGNKKQAQELAIIILIKKIKAPSFVIQSIKRDMQRIIDKYKTNNPKQDNALVKLFHEAVLPP